MIPSKTAHNLRWNLVSQLARQTVGNLLGWWAIAVTVLIEELVNAAGPLGGAITNEAWLLESALLTKRASSW